MLAPPSSITSARVNMPLLNIDTVVVSSPMLIIAHILLPESLKRLAA